MRIAIWPSAILGLTLAFSDRPASGVDHITLRNGRAITGDVIGFKENTIKCGTAGSVESVPVRDVHSIKFDGKIDMAAFVMKNGQVIEGEIVSYWSGKATLAGQHEIALADVREMFLIREPMLPREDVPADRRIGEWLVDDPEKKFYAIVLERVEGQVLMRKAGRMAAPKDMFLEEIEPGIKFVVDGDPPDKFMKIARNGDLEFWIAKKRVAALKPIKQRPQADR